MDVGVLIQAASGHLSRILPMMQESHAESGIASTDSRRRAALEPLLRGTPLGSVWLVGPKLQPVGYLAVGYAQSLAAGGVVALLDEFWLRPEARRQGLGSRALEDLASEVQMRGALALIAELSKASPRSAAFLARRGFFRREGAEVAVRRL